MYSMASTWLCSTCDFLDLKIDLKRNLLNYECLILPLCRKDGQREKLVERHVDSSLFCGFIIQAKQRYQNGNP